jgi:hypothetical protein
MARRALLIGVVIGLAGCVEPQSGRRADGALGEQTDDAAPPSGDVAMPAGDAPAPPPPDAPAGDATAGTATNGTACSSADACLSGQCVDGVCCESACGGQCEACAESSSRGKCVVITGIPRGSRGFCPGTSATCAATCNGVTRATCSYPGDEKECAAASCQNGSAYARSTCDGKGTCAPQTSVACGAPGCAGSICAGGCSAQSPCPAGEYCNAGRCFPKLAVGQPCSAAESCSSGNCVDKVCCASACNGLCEACSSAKTGGSDGTCSPVKAGTNPDQECADEGASSCGKDGACDGARACRRYGSGTPCATATCGASGFTPARTCDGKGTCTPASATSCGSYACFASGCRTSCTVDGDCQPPAVCVSGSCGSKKGQGAGCSGGAECASGACVDGVCCDNACTGLCTACRQSKTGQSEGKCAPVSAGTDPDNECTDQGAASCGQDGMCNGSGACRKYGNGTPCGSSTCNGTKFVSGGQCNGSGVCGGGGQTECSPYACTASGCKAAPCASDADCAGGFGCSPNNNTCQAKTGTWVYFGYFGGGEIIDPPGPDPTGSCVPGQTRYYKVASTTGLECKVTRDPGLDFACSGGMVGFTQTDSDTIRDCASNMIYSPSGYRKSLPNYSNWCLPAGSTTAACLQFPHTTGCDRSTVVGRLWRCK